MTRSLSDLSQSANELLPLIAVVRAASTGSAAFTYADIDIGVIKPCTSAVVLLLSARFEEYLRSAIESAIAQFTTASPPVNRTALSAELQLRILTSNIKSATQESVHGVRRDAAARIAAVTQVASRIVNYEIWGDDAIDTAGNPGRATVSNLLAMIGIQSAWVAIEAAFAINWRQRRIIDSALKQIPRAADELDTLMNWRNACAHTSAMLPLGERDLLDAVAYVGCLAETIDGIICREIDLMIVGCGSRPSSWPI